MHLNYAIYGEGKPVLILHGLGCDHRMMKACLEPIFSKNAPYKRIYVDLPGMGKSTCAIQDASADNILEVLVHFIEDVIQEHCLVIGQSYGGYIARGIVAKCANKIEGLMLLCPVIFPEQEDRNVPNQIYTQKDTLFLRSLQAYDRQHFSKYAVLANEQTYKRYQAELLTAIQHTDIVYIKALKEHYRLSFDVDAFIKQYPFDKPVLCICGRQDICVGYKDAWQLLDSYPRATFSVLDVAGHHLQIEQPALLRELTSNWLQRVEQAIHDSLKPTLEVKFHDTVDDSLVKFVVIACKYQNQWLLVKHKKRDTMEIPGGHREVGESVYDAAVRELQEETGAIQFSLKPVTFYSVTGKTRVNEAGGMSYGALFYSNIDTLSEIDSEIECYQLYDALPDNLTYPDIQPILLQYLENKQLKSIV